MATSLRAAVYEVGPGHLASPGEVPWETLAPGDTVLIHWQPAPYREKWVLCRAGTAAQPIMVRGVPGPQGELPVIDGENAHTRAALDYWGEERSVIKIGGASRPADTLPAFIVLENLEVRGALPPRTFASPRGAVKTYHDQAAAIFIEKGDDITIRHCTLHDCAQGLFVASNETHASSRILVEGCSIYGNGVVKSPYQHNSYTAAAGIVFRFNRYGPLRPGSPGNNLKDRSAGLVVANNWIEDGNRTLDLVDGQDSALIRGDARYRRTDVYGNVLIKTAAAPGQQVVHYGGDSGHVEQYRKGTLSFHHNTLVSARPDKTTLLRLSTDEEHCECRDNLLFVTGAGRTLALLDSAGTLLLSHNWLKPDWRSSFGKLTGTIKDDGTNLSGPAPGFFQESAGDYRLAAASPCVGAAGPQPEVAAPEPRQQYRAPQAGEPRPDAARSIGAFAPVSGAGQVQP